MAEMMSGGMELDPLLRDLTERKKSFRRGVASLASELKDARRRLAQQEESLGRETRTRQAAERRAKSLEEELCVLRSTLEKRDEELRGSVSSVHKYQRDLEVLRSQLQATQALADESTSSAQSEKAQCSLLLKEIGEKNKSLKEQEELVNKFVEQVGLLQKDLDDRESSQKQLKDEVARIEKEIMLTIVKAGNKKNCDPRKIFAEISPKKFENVSNNMGAKDEEINLLRNELRSISALWKHKTKELELKLEKHQKADQDLRKRVFKLEFCLQEARAQARKLQKMDEKRDIAIKELSDQLAMRRRQQQQQSKDDCLGKNFWESSAFKMFASMSMLVLVVFAKR